MHLYVTIFTGMSYEHNLTAAGGAKDSKLGPVVSRRTISTNEVGPKKPGGPMAGKLAPRLGTTAQRFSLGSANRAEKASSSAVDLGDHVLGINFFSIIVEDVVPQHLCYTLYITTPIISRRTSGLGAEADGPRPRTTPSRM